MRFPCFAKTKFIRKAAVFFLGFSFLLGGCEKTPNPSALKDETALSSPEEAIREGENSLLRFKNSLSKIRGIEGSLSLDLSIANPNEGSHPSNVVSIRDAKVRLGSPNDKIEGFSLEGEADYNAVKKNLSLVYVDKTMYLNLAGLTYKYSDSTYKSLVGKFISIFGLSSLYIPDSLYEALDKISSPQDNIDFFFEKKTDMGYCFTLNLGKDNSVFFQTDDDYSLKSISSSKLNFGNISFSFEILTVKDDKAIEKIRASVPQKPSEYVEVYDAMELVRKIKNLSDSKRFGFKLSASFIHKVPKTNHHPASEERFAIESSNYLNFDSGVFASGISFKGENENPAAQTQNSVSFFSELDEEKMRKTYVNYNDVVKVMTTNEVMERLLAKMKETSSFDLLQKILDLLDSQALKEIKNGRYQSIVGSLYEVKNSGPNVDLSFSLGSFGLGEDSKLKLEISGNSDKSLLKASFRSLEIGALAFEKADLEIIPYQSQYFDKEGYPLLTRLPSIYEQIHDLLASPSVKMSLTGSFKDENGVGVEGLKANASLFATKNDDSYSFDGAGIDLDVIQQVAVNSEEGNFIRLGERKNHHLTMDIEKMDEAYFHYYDAGNVSPSKRDNGTWGKLKIASFQSIIDIAKDIYNSEDERFSKWFKVFGEVTASNVLEALKTGQYAPLIASNLIVSSSFGHNETRLTLSGKAFGLKDKDNERNFSIILTYNGDLIETISVKGLFVSGKEVDLKVKLEANEEARSPLLDHSKSSYIDFTGLSSLVSATYNTAKLKTFHLVAKDLGTKILFSDIRINADFYLFTDGSIVKCYGKIHVPCISLVNQSFSLWTYYRTVMFYFDDIDPETGKAYEDNHGYVYLTYNRSTKKGQESGGKEFGAYKYHSDYFKNDPNKIVNFLLKDVIGLTDSVYGQVANTIAKNEGKATDYEKVITAFSYNVNDNSYRIGLDLANLANSSALGKLDATIEEAPSQTLNGEHCLSKMTISLPIIMLVTLNITGVITNAGLDVEDNWSPVSEKYQRYIDAHRNDPCTHR